MRYVIGSGYIGARESVKEAFARVWLDNTVKYSSPERIVILTSCGAVFPIRQVKQDPYFIQQIAMSGDLGSCGALLHGSKTYQFNGWMGNMLALALIAYNDEADFIYKEEDCLAFGPWVDKMYDEIGSGGVIFGDCKDGHIEKMPCAQSLFLVRHSFIPEFVSTLLSSPAQNCDAELGEHKFKRFQDGNPTMWKRFSFGYDRGRPFNVDDPVFYIQQITNEELLVLVEKGLM